MAQFRTVFSALVIAIALEACNDMAMKKEASLNDRLAGKSAISGPPLAAPEAVGAYRLGNSQSGRTAHDEHERENQRDAEGDARRLAQRGADGCTDRERQKDRRQDGGGDAADHSFCEKALAEKRAGERKSKRKAAGDPQGGRDPAQPETLGSVMPNLPRSASPSACASPRDGRWRMRTRYAILSASLSGEISAG